MLGYRAVNWWLVQTGFGADGWLCFRVFRIGRDLDSCVRVQLLGYRRDQKYCGR